jgi:hypothetical protein
MRSIVVVSSCILRPPDESRLVVVYTRPRSPGCPFLLTHNFFSCAWPFIYQALPIWNLRYEATSGNKLRSEKKRMFCSSERRRMGGGVMVVA